MEFLDIINDQDNVIGKASKQEVYEKLLTHRIVHILIFNDKNEMALQMQSKNKRFCPLHWSTAVGGHVRSGETYEQAALREMGEEIGISTKIEPVFKDNYIYTDEYDHYYGNKVGPRKGLKKILFTFKTVYNGPFNVNPKEVKQIEFFSLDNIKDMIGKEKFHPELLFLLKKHYNIS